MAATTTTTSSSNILAKWLSGQVLGEITPLLAVENHVNYEQLDGKPSKVASIPKAAVLDAATSVNEGADMSTITTLGYGTAVDITPAKIFVRADITMEEIEAVMPGVSRGAIVAQLNSDNYNGLFGLVESRAARMMEPIHRHREGAIFTALATATANSTDDNAAASFPKFLEALHKLNALKPRHRNYVFVGETAQISHLRAAALSLSSGSSAVWNTQADASFVNNLKDPQMNQMFVGSSLGVAFYEGDASLMPLTGTSDRNRVGFLFARGQGSVLAPGAGFLRGPVSVVERGVPFFTVRWNDINQTIRVILAYSYAAGLTTDEHVVKLITRAAY